MLTVETLSNIENILTSEALTIKGHQMLAIVNILQMVGNEKQAVMLAMRASPTPSAPPPPPEKRAA